MISTDSPGPTLVLEQYPSIHGQRYFVGGETFVLDSIQSVVPGFSFSARIRSGLLGFGFWGVWAPGDRTAPRAVPAVVLSKLRRVNSEPESDTFHLTLHLSRISRFAPGRHALYPRAAVHRRRHAACRE